LVWPYLAYGDAFDVNNVNSVLFDNDNATDYLIALAQLLPGTIVETVLFGASVILFIIALSTMIRSKRSYFSIQSAVIPVCACIMFAFALAHWSLTISTLVGQHLCPLSLFSAGCQDVSTSGNISIGPIILLSLNIVLSDIIVLWRAYVAWDRRYWVRVVCGLLSVCTFITSIIFIKNTMTNSNSNVTSPLNFTNFTQSGFENTELGIAVLTTSLLSNVCATILIAFKAWNHRREVAKLNVVTRRTLVERVLALLIESGFVYACIWVLYIISSTSNLLDIPGFPDVPLSALSSLTPASYGFDSAMVQITSMYPTLLLILISLGKIQHQELYVKYSPTQVPRTRVTQPITVDVEIGVERSTGTIMVIGDDSTGVDGESIAHMVDSKAG